MILGVRVLILLVLIYVLIKSSDIVIFTMRRIAKRTGAGVFVFSLIIAALGTSLPELFISVVSAFEGMSNLSLGVVIGSNIANISLIGGMAAFVVGKVFINEQYLRRDVFVALIAGISPFVLMLDGRLGRVDGLILLVMYGVYATSLFKERFHEIHKDEPRESTFHRIFRKLTHISGSEERDFFRLFLGIGIMIVSADLIVKDAEAMAISFGVPVLVIGFFVLAIGTSLPELAFSFRSLEDKFPSMFLGNLLGSTIVNSTLIVGLVAFISPIEIVDFNDYSVAAVAFVVVFLTFWFFVKSKHRLDRWEALLLLVIYTFFAFMEFI